MDNPIPIRLKRKYLSGFKGSQKGGGNRQGTKRRSKLNDRQKKLLPPQPKMAMLLRDGRCRMIRVA